MEKSELVQVAYDIGISSSEKIFDTYDKHAANYSEFYGTLKIPDHAVLAKYMIDKGFPVDIPILDVGCGSGLTIEALAKVGFTNISGVDGSKGMLEESKNLGLYKDLVEGYVGLGKFPEELKGKFKVAVTAGTFIRSHFPSVAVDEVLTCFEGKKGDAFIIVFREDCYESLGHKAHIEKLVAEGKIEIVETMPFERGTDNEMFKDPLFAAKTGSILVHLALT